MVHFLPKRKKDPSDVASRLGFVNYDSDTVANLIELILEHLGLEIDRFEMVGSGLKLIKKQQINTEEKG